MHGLIMKLVAPAQPVRLRFLLPECSSNATPSVPSRGFGSSARRSLDQGPSASGLHLRLPPMQCNSKLVTVAQPLQHAQMRTGDRA